MSANVLIRDARRDLGEELFALARLWSHEGAPNTKKARQAAVAALPVLPTRFCTKAAQARAAEEVYKVSRLIAAARRNRLRRRCVDRDVAYRPERSRPAIRRLDFTAPLEQRLVDRTVELVERAARRCYRYGAAGGHSLTVRVTTDPAEIGYTVRIDRNYRTYRGRFRRYAAAEDHHTVVVPRRWLRTVYRAGLTIIDGMLTIDAAPMVCPVDGIKLYSASWAVQSQGYQVRVEHGYIAVMGHDAYHAATPQRALTGLARKVRSALRRLPPKVADAMARAAAVYGRVLMSRDDAYAIGACEYGVAHWMYRTGLSGCDTATIAEVVAAWRRHPAPEAVRAVYHAIRRHRQSLRAAGGRAAA